MKLVRAIRNGWLKTKEQLEKEATEAPATYLLWAGRAEQGDRWAASSPLSETSEPILTLFRLQLGAILAPL